MRRLIGIACALGLAACASTPPPRELLDARAAYARAQAPAADRRASGEARVALERAEASYERSPKSDETRDLAYVAHRKALALQVSNEAMQASEAAAITIAAIHRDAELRKANAIELAKRKVEEKRERIQSERRARVEAEGRANEKLARLDGPRSHMTDRGVAIGFVGGELFAPGTSDLLPSAEPRLREIAAAIKGDSRIVTIIDHTCVGKNPEHNRELSRERADTVRTALYRLGVDPARLRSEAKGEFEPKHAGDDKPIDIVFTHDDSIHDDEPSLESPTP